MARTWRRQQHFNTFFQLMPLRFCLKTQRNFGVFRFLDVHPLRRDPDRKESFPTCQVRVVRFYVSLPSPPPPPAPPASHPPAGPQPRLCEISVACRTSTAIPWVQCCVPDLNRDPVRSVLRAGPQLRSREFSVACRTSTNLSCPIWGCCCFDLGLLMYSPFMMQQEASHQKVCGYWPGY